MMAFDQRLGEHAVEFVDQIPGAFIRHLHRLRGPGDRSVLADEFEELDPAVANVAIPFEVNTNFDHGHRNIAFALGNSNGYGVLCLARVEPC